MLDLDGCRVDLIVGCFLDLDGCRVELIVVCLLDLDGCRVELFVLCFLDLDCHLVTFLRGCGHLLLAIAMSESPIGKAQSSYFFPPFLFLVKRRRKMTKGMANEEGID